MKKNLTIIILIFVIIHFVSLPLFALPEGQVVESGSVVFDQPNATTLNITASDKSIINFNTFNIGQNETVNFYQPNSSSTVLGRVLGAGASNINGSLTANGILFLTNPNGFNFGPQANVQVNSLIASTLEISTNNFINGNYIFNHRENAAYARIINEGIIEGNNIALVASAVKNTGVILAKAGTAHLASGDKTTITIDNRGLIQVEINEKTSGKVYDSNGVALKDAVANSGTVEGAQVYMSAKTASDIFENAVNQTGIIKANGLVNENGIIRIVSNEKIKLSGSLTADKGEIKVSSEKFVNVSAELNISAATAEINSDKDLLVDANITNDSGDLHLFADYDGDGVGEFTQSTGEIYAKDSGDVYIDGSGVMTLNKIKTDLGAIKIGTLRAPSSISGKPHYIHTVGDFEFDSSSDGAITTTRGDVLRFNPLGSLVIEAINGAIKFLEGVVINVAQAEFIGNSLFVNTISSSVTFYKNIGDFNITSFSTTDDLATLEGEDVKVTYLKSNDVTLKSDNSVNSTPGVIIQAPEVRVIAQKFGSIETPLNIKSPLIYLERLHGAIEILESSGIGTSVMLRGPPDGFGAIIYNHDTNLTLKAEVVRLIGTDSIQLYGNITFSSLECTIPNKEIYFEAGKTYTITGVFHFSGKLEDDGTISYIHLKSSEDGVRWFIDPQGAHELSYVRAEDSYNLDPRLILGTSLDHDANSYNWDAPRYWLGTTSTSWNNTLNWSATDGGAGGAGVPTSADDVYFSSTRNNACSIDTTAVCLSFTIGDLYTQTVSMAAGSSLAVTNDLTLTGSGALSPAGRPISVGGNWTVGANGVFTRGTSTVTFNGTNAVNPQQINSGGTTAATKTFYNIIINNTGAGVKLVTNSLTQSTGGTLTMTAGTLDLNALTWTLGADLSVTAGTIAIGTGYLDCASYDLTVGTGGTVTIGTTGTLRVTDFSVTNTGIFTCTGNATLNILGNVVITSSGWSAGNSTIYMKSTTQTINASQAIYNLHVNCNDRSSNSLTIVTNDLICNGDLLFEDEDANTYIDTNSKNLTVYGTITLNWDGIIRLNAASAPSTLTIGNDMVFISVHGTPHVQLYNSTNTISIVGYGGLRTIPETITGLDNNKQVTLNNISLTTAQTLTGSSAITLAGSATLAGITLNGATATLNVGAQTLTMTGNLLVTTGIVTITSGGSIALGSNSFTNSGGTGVTSAGTITCGAFTSSGTFANNAGSAINASGNVAISGTFSTPANNTLTMTGAGTTLNASVGIGNLQINNGASVSISTNNLSIGGTLVIGQGTGGTSCSLDTNSKNLTVVGTTTVNSEGVLILTAGAATSTMTFTGDFTNSGIVRVVDVSNARTSLVGATGALRNFSGNGLTFNSRIINLNNIKYNPAFTPASSEGAILTGNCTFASVITLNGGSVNTGSYTLTVQNTITINSGTILTSGGIIDAGTNTFSLLGGTVQSGGTIICGDFISSGGNYVNNSGSIINSSGSVTITGTFTTPTNNTLTMTGAGKTINASAGIGNLIINSSGTVSVSTNALSVGGNLTIQAGIFDSGGLAINVTGNWNNSGGTFTHSNNTVTLNGTALQTVTSNGSSFNILTITNTSTVGVAFADRLQVATLNATAGVKKLSFAAASSASPHTISTTFNIAGSAGNLLTLAPSASNTTWYIDAPTSSVSYVSVSYSSEASGKLLTATNSTDAGNNANWIFPGYLKITGTGTMTAGGSQIITITAYDGNGNISTSYSGDKNLIFSGANSSPSPVTSPTATNKSSSDTNFGSTTVVTFANGVGSSTVKLYKAETASLAVTDGVISTSQDAYKLSVVVSVGVKNQLVWATQPTQSVTSGTTLPAFSIEITDSYGNRTTDSDNIAITASSGLLNGSTMKSAVNGLATFNNVSVFTAGNITLKGTASGLTSTASSNLVTVNGSGSESQGESVLFRGSSIMPQPIIEYIAPLSFIYNYIYGYK
ncbi:MAG: filamentous hemagglutinin N-terminal domain-containing protein [Candidatus Omnitrophica bacterium]|nr:filamentous hemagglutinin N-terminal domain-containing protein [Candidatus Omnitrophota bacterium]